MDKSPDVVILAVEILPFGVVVILPVVVILVADNVPVALILPADNELLFKLKLLFITISPVTPFCKTVVFTVPVPAKFGPVDP